MDHEGLGFLASPTNHSNIYCVTAGQYWLSIAKPKNGFRSTLKASDSSQSVENSLKQEIYEVS